MSAHAIYTCHACSGPAFGAFCSYRCWRIARGLATDATPPAWPTRMIEAHAAAPKIYAKGSTPKGLVAPATAAKADQVDRAADAAEAIELADTIHQVEDNRPACIACGDTGRNSKGGQCVPCVRAGRVAADPPPEYSQPIDQVEAIERPPAIAPTNHQTRSAEAGQLSLF